MRFLWSKPSGKAKSARAIACVLQGMAQAFFAQAFRF